QAGTSRRRGSSPLPRRRSRTARTRRNALRSTADAVHRPARGLPRVVRGARPVLGDVVDDARVAADVLRALRVVEQVRIVALLPDEDQMRGRHEDRDERAPRRGTREWIGADAAPAFMVAAILRPELLVLRLQLLLIKQLDASRLQRLHAPRPAKR